MADIHMCDGGGCPLKTSCYRFNAKAGLRQAYFTTVPYENGKCEYYSEEIK